jgi:hypothetical protein
MTRTLAVAGVLWLATTLWAGGPDEKDDVARSDPYFVGYETEPAMDSGGRTIASLGRAGSAGFDRLLHADRHSWLRPIWEVPIAVPLTLVQHEGFGHGARARELGLRARYGVTVDGAYTDLEEIPESSSDIGLISGGGTEANGVMARRLLLDAQRRQGVPGSMVPTYVIAKLDLPLYVWSTVEPRAAGPATDDETNGNAQSFVEQYTSGNDIAFYLVARQAQRRGTQSVQELWDGTYEIDFDEARLTADWRDLRSTAVWAAADPALVVLLFSYVRDHVVGHDPQVHPLSIPLGRGLGMTLSTRAALAPTYLTRFLDVLVTTPRGVLCAYVRDLDSREDRGFGLGVSLERFEASRHVTLGLSGDIWKEPASREGGSRRNGWNVTGEAEVRFSRRVGLSVMAGAKSDGYFPGRPSRDGFYLGVGALVFF